MPVKMTEKLILAIVSYMYERGRIVSKTKLLKLLYLCDLEFMRAYGHRLTDFDWKFHHLGPWARAYDEVLNTLVSRKELVEVPTENYEYDTTLYRTPLAVSQLRALFTTPQESFTVEHVVHKWFEVPTRELLNFVYFHTEPMVNAERGERLRFDTLEAQPPKKFLLESSGLSRKEIQRVRNKFRAKLQQLPNSGTFKFTPPRYDDEFNEAMAKLDDLSS
jgi:hypothetical protein